MLAYAPLYPYPKPEKWNFIVGDPLTNTVYARAEAALVEAEALGLAERVAGSAKQPLLLTGGPDGSRASEAIRSLPAVVSLLKTRLGSTHQLHPDVLSMRQGMVCCQRSFPSVWICYLLNPPSVWERPYCFSPSELSWMERIGESIRLWLRHAYQSALRSRV